MCLHNKKEDVLKFLKDKARNKSGKVIVYKVLAMHNFKFYSPYYWTPWYNGINRSNSKVKKPILKDQKINRGIHVYLSLDSAKKHFSLSAYFFRCTANIKDLIGVNYEADRAVFSKISINLPKQFFGPIFPL